MKFTNIFSLLTFSLPVEIVLFDAVVEKIGSALGDPSDMLILEVISSGPVTDIVNSQSFPTGKKVRGSMLDLTRVTPLFASFMGMVNDWY